jgi:hypothetical protein
MSQTLDTSQFTGCIRAERKGTNTLILRKLDAPFRRFDGKMARYELEHRWHKSESSPVTSVQGNDFTYWQRKEFDPSKPLFEQFSCTG